MTEMGKGVAWCVCAWPWRPTVNGQHCPGVVNERPPLLAQQITGGIAT